MDKKFLFPLLVLMALLVIGLAIAGPGGKKGKPAAKECRDGLDNDGDGSVDLADAGCEKKQDNDETNCGDGVCEGGETISSCSLDCLPEPVCGNDIVEGDEVCDGTDLAGETCSSQGYSGGALECTGTCDAFDTENCYVNTCTDSDGGIVVDGPGRVYGENEGTPYSIWDKCNTNSTLLEEMRCNGNIPEMVLVDCLEISGEMCSLGVCLM
ncbi:hypothetical protein ACFL1B_00790 [Nanoarchaeota archaeon]